MLNFIFLKKKIKYVKLKLQKQIKINLEKLEFRLKYFFK